MPPSINKTQLAVSQAIAQLRHDLPFALLGLDSDNGSEFINETLYRYCLAEQITFTRSRPYQKNDQAHVEQKNWSVVRHTIGYDRLETADELAMYGKTIRTYDQATTPYRQVLWPSKPCRSRSKRA